LEPVFVRTVLRLMVHELPEWIRRLRAQFPSESLWPVEGSLAGPILDHLAALEDAERRRSFQAEQRQPRPRLRVVK
jgi:hypothetical protein